MAGHAAHDSYESYMPMELLAEWTDKDPLKRLEQDLREQRGMDEPRLDGIRERVRDEVREAVERADDDGTRRLRKPTWGVFAGDEPCLR